MAIPILDTTVAVSSRLYRGISPFQGGTDHLSHRLVRLGLTRKYAAISLWSFAAFFGSSALALYTWPDSIGTPLIIFIGALWLALLTFFLRIPSEDR
jgi:UDP-GlcNAc:undecaprenyl-phosphate GlcNAc-1-phosphate transferase